MPRKALIQIRRGTEAELAGVTLAVGELGFTTDTNKLYIGTPTGNVLLVNVSTAGDMVKGVYDTDNDGKVDAAEAADSVPWAGVTGKPATFTPSGHKASHASGGSDAISPADIGAVSKAGDTMTGTLIADMDVGPSDTRIYKNLASYKNISANLTGALKISLPKSWSNTMLRIRIVGYDYSINSAWELTVAGYNFTGTPGWINYSAELRGMAPFDSVRLGHNGTVNCILLGTTTTTWQYPHVVVDELIAGFGAVTGWESGWQIALITDETGIRYIVTPALRKFWHAGNDGAGSGLDADLLDGQHASAFMPKGPVTWNQLAGL